jgi:hypothetical protein
VAFAGSSNKDNIVCGFELEEDSTFSYIGKILILLILF